MLKRNDGKPQRNSPPRISCFYDVSFLFWKGQYESSFQGFELLSSINEWSSSGDPHILFAQFFALALLVPFILRTHVVFTTE